jgi:hypothetical protein
VRACRRTRSSPRDEAGSRVHRRAAA